MKRFALLIALITSGTTANAGYDEPLPAKLAFRPQLQVTDSSTMVISFQIPPGYYLYRKRLSILDAQGFQVTGYQVGGTKVIDDPITGSEEVLDAGSRIIVRGAATAPASGVQLRLKMQGCLKDQVCYPPEVRTLISR